MELKVKLESSRSFLLLLYMHFLHAVEARRKIIN